MNSEMPVWGPTFTQKFIDFKKEFDFTSYSQKMKQAGVDFVALCDKEYPKLLKQLDDAPIVLFYKGDIDVLRGSVANGAEVYTKIFSLPASRTIRFFKVVLDTHCII